MAINFYAGDFSILLRSTAQRIMKIRQYLQKLQQKISGTFFLDTVYNVAYGREIKYICMSFVGVGVAAGNKYVFLTATRELLAVGKLQYNTVQWPTVIFNYRS